MSVIGVRRVCSGYPSKWSTNSVKWYLPSNLLSIAPRQMRSCQLSLGQRSIAYYSSPRNNNNRFGRFLSEEEEDNEDDGYSQDAQHDYRQYHALINQQFFSQFRPLPLTLNESPLLPYSSTSIKSISAADSNSGNSGKVRNNHRERNIFSGEGFEAEEHDAIPVFTTTDNDQSTQTIPVDQCTVLAGSEDIVSDEGMSLSSVLKKRRKKMRKHKDRKRWKETRTQRRRRVQQKKQARKEREEKETD